MKFNRLKYDLKYMILNFIINRIPSWYVRKFFYKLLGMKIGAGSRVGINTIVVEPQNIVIGERTIINEFCYLDGRGGIVIGDDTSISIQTMFSTGTHNMRSGDFAYESGEIMVGNNVWIGARAVILNDTVIENEAVIGAGCVFKGNAAKKDVFVGNPARKVKERELEKTYHIDYNPFFR